MTRRLEKSAKGTNTFIYDSFVNAGRWRLGAMGAIGVFSFIIYWLTLCPTISSGDSGELVNVSFGLGVAHPPGYPLYTLLAHLFTYLPFGNVAWRVNLFSAVTTAITSVIVFEIVFSLRKNPLAAAMAGLMYSFTPLIWRYALVAEVFALNNLIFSLLLLMAVKFVYTKEVKYIYWSALLIGLGVSHHHTIIFAALPIGIFFLWQAWHEIRPQMIKLCAVMVLGLTPYLYTILAAQKWLPVSWGQAHTWAGFWKHFFRQEYGTFRLASQLIGAKELQLFTGLFEFLKYAGQQMLWVGLLLSAYGVYRGLKDEKLHGLFKLMVGVFVFYLFTFHALGNLSFENSLMFWTYSRFWLVPMIFVVCWFGVGLTYLPQRWPAWTAPSVGAILIVSQLSLNYSAEDQSRNVTFLEYGKALLEATEPNSILLTRGDLQTNSVRYAQMVEGLRPDVVILDRALMTKPWYRPVIEKNFADIRYPGNFYRPGQLHGFNLQQFFAANMDHRPIFTTDFETVSAYEAKDQSWTEQYELWPRGFVNHVKRKSAPVDMAEIKKSVDALSFDLDTLKRHRSGVWESMVENFYWKSHFGLARSLVQSVDTKSLSNVEAKAALTTAEKVMKDLITQAPIAHPEYFKALGLIYQKLSVFDQSAKNKMVEAWKTYIDRTPASDPDRKKIVKLLSR